MAYIFHEDQLPRLLSVVPGRERTFFVNPELAIVDDMLAGVERGLDIALRLRDGMPTDRIVVVTGNVDPARFAEHHSHPFGYPVQRLGIELVGGIGREHDTGERLVPPLRL